MAAVLRVPITYNFRAVAGATVGGRPLRPGLFYRSDALDGLTAEGRRTLVDLGIARVIDLRSPEERLQAPDLLDGLDAEVIALPILSANSFRPDEVDLRRVYRSVLDTYGTRVGAAIRAIAESSGPLIVHCTAGKDRTGLVVALALLAVGVDYSWVAQDYVATETNLAGAWSEQMLARVATYGIVPAAPLVEVLTRSPEPVLRDTVDWLAARPGGLTGYLDSVGVGAEVVTRLRENLLGPA